MAKELKIRKAKISELKSIQDLNHKLFREDADRDKFLNHNWPYKDGEKYFKSRIEGKGLCLIAEIDGEIVGYLCGSIKQSESWRPVKRTELENMRVKRHIRSKGVGAKLVDEFLKWSKKQKCSDWRKI